MPLTMYDKIWQAHVVRQAGHEPTILYIDLHLIHEVTSPQAFTGLQKRNMKVRRPDLTVATIDHAVPSKGRLDAVWPLKAAQEQAQRLIENCTRYGIQLYGIGSDHQGIVHVIGPELGLTRPGMTIVCGDSHTSTHGAFGALAFGIGTSEVEHVLATQCLLQNKTRTMAIKVDGSLGKGVYSKDIILTIINKIGVSGGTGYTLEYRGSAIEKLSMEARMSICNMSIEAGARAGMVAPDQTTVEYLSGKIWGQGDNSCHPERDEGDTNHALSTLRQAQRDNGMRKKIIDHWLSFRSDSGAQFDSEVAFDADGIEPMVTWGTNPGMSVKVTETIPEDTTDPDVKKALDYMDLRPGQAMAGQSIDYVFFGSCTNSRIEDLRVAASILKGQKISKEKIAYVVPGSMQVKVQAEQEGLRDIFIDAGCEWRDPGCSSCLAMNGDFIPAGKYCASTSNRNFMGRQGQGARTFLMSPAMAAVAAIEGCVRDVREYV